MSSPSAPNQVAGAAAPRGVWVALRDAGIDLERCAREAGIAGSKLGDEPRLEPHEVARLLDRVFERDAAIGLRIGAAVRPELFGVVGLAALSAPTYGAAIACCARYKRVVGELAIGVERRRGRAIVRVAGIDGRAAAPGRAEVELAFFVSLGRHHASSPVAPHEIRLRSANGSPAEYERLLGCPVRFGHRADELVLDASALDVPMLGADAQAHPFLVIAAERRLERDDDVVARARVAIERMLPDRAPDVRGLARAVGMSERSLQRRLRDHGTTFRDVLDDTRRSIALRHLSGGLAPAEVAFLAGFTHLSSFYRSFRRWTGSTPDTFASSAERDRSRRAGDERRGPSPRREGPRSAQRPQLGVRGSSRRSRASQSARTREGSSAPRNEADPPRRRVRDEA